MQCQQNQLVAGRLVYELTINDSIVVTLEMVIDEAASAIASDNRLSAWRVWDKLNIR